MLPALTCEGSSSSQSVFPAGEGKKKNQTKKTPTKQNKRHIQL